MTDVVPMNSSRSWAAEELRNLADSVERGEAHGLVFAAVFSDEVADRDNRATASYHWVAEDKANPRLMRLALGGMLHELATRLFGFVDWYDLDDMVDP